MARSVAELLPQPFTQLDLADIEALVAVPADERETLYLELKRQPAVDKLAKSCAAFANSSDVRGDLVTRLIGDTARQAEAAAAALRRERDVTREATSARLLERLARAELAASSRARQEGSVLQQIGKSVNPLRRARRLQIGPPPLCDGRRATIVGTNGADVITGTVGRDVIAGLGGDDQIHGRGQNDIICGGDGDDLIFGGGGNDQLFGGGGNDFVDGGGGDDTMDGGGQQFDAAAFFDETGPVTANLVTGTASGDGNDSFTNVSQLHGGDFADTFYGNAGDNGLFGNGGNDTLYGGDGNDGLSGGPGNDTIDGGIGTFDSVTFWDATGGVTASLTDGTSSGGGEGNDTFTGVEVLNGGPYDDNLTGVRATAASRAAEATTRSSAAAAASSCSAKMATTRSLAAMATTSSKAVTATTRSTAAQERSAQSRTSMQPVPSRRASLRALQPATDRTRSRTSSSSERLLRRHPVRRAPQRLDPRQRRQRHDHRRQRQ